MFEPARLSAAWQMVLDRDAIAPDSVLTLPWLVMIRIPLAVLLAT
ncbi:MAG: hypothetical protein ACFE0J_03775 [Elainellaceae cyanobacterium]